MNPDARTACEQLAEHGITIPVEPFARELARRTAAAKSEGALHVFDLALAWACGQKNESALHYFERT